MRWMLCAASGEDRSATSCGKSLSERGPYAARCSGNNCDAIVPHIFWSHEFLFLCAWNAPHASRPWTTSTPLKPDRTTEQTRRRRKKKILIENMTCRLCGQVGESSDNPLITLQCDHVFHQNCVPDEVCPICTTNDVCTVCLEPITDPEIDALAGCIHRFHPGCIIPYFRMGNGKCPVCQRNPHAQDVTDERSDSDFDESGSDEDEYSMDDETWEATKKIRTLQLQKASRSKDTTVQKKVKSINAELRRARQAKDRADAIRAEKMKSPQFLQLVEDLQKAKETRKRVGKDLVQTRRTWRKAGRDIRKLSNSIWRIKHRRRFARGKSKKQILSRKSILGSEVDPEYQYLMENGEWSDKIHSERLRALYAAERITNATMIRHRLFPDDVQYGVLRGYFERHFI